jgi:hypothetical protein
MDAEERSGLRNILVGYFGDNTTERGIREMVGLTRSRVDYHHRYRGLLETALRAARAGDEDVFLVARQMAPFLPDLAAAVALLEEILTEYDRQYAAGPSGTGATPSA